MVALAGSGWRLAPCLVVLWDEANTIAPDRNRKADGSIGDRAHAARTSDHNPSDGYVHALDLTHAPASGFDAHARARMLVARKDRRIKYVISNGEIARSYDKPGIPAWSWAPYYGSNPHTFHAHFSVHSDPTIRGDTSPWWPTVQPPTPLPEDPMTYQLDIESFVRSCYAEAGRKADTEGVNYWTLTAASSDDPKGVLNYMRGQLKLEPIS